MVTLFADVCSGLPHFEIQRRHTGMVFEEERDKQRETLMKYVNNITQRPLNPCNSNRRNWLLSFPIKMGVCVQDTGAITYKRHMAALATLKLSTYKITSACMHGLEVTCDMNMIRST